MYGNSQKQLILSKYWLLCTLSFTLSILNAQRDSIVTSPISDKDTLLSPPASLGQDSIPRGSLNQKMLDSISTSLNKRPAPQSTRRQEANPTGTKELPEGSVEYGSQDSSRTDIIKQQIHLYGKAYARYDEFDITADYIIFDLEKNEVEALTRPNQIEKPSFKNGSQVVQADQIRYNLDSEKGIVHGARIQQDQFYIHGATTKFVRAGRDSLHIDDVIYNRNAVLTTCELDHPHWGIRTTKLKMIPDKLAVVGPFDLELAGIPTPLALPFAFAPLFSIGRSTSGIIFPEREPLNISARNGIGTRGIGYYFALSDKMDLKLTGDIYTRGTFALNAESNYKKRYKHNGRINIGYSREIQDLESSISPNIQKSYSISISHNQDSKAHPYRKIGGSLRFTVNDFDRRNYSDANSQLNSQINSNFAYTYKISNKTNFSTSIQHSQNTQSRAINFTLPEMQLRMSRIFPFKRKGSSAASEKWFEKVNMQYNGKFQNKVSTVDTLLFTSDTWSKFRSGVSHEVDVGASYKLLQNINFNTNASYDEFWYFQTYRASEADSLGNLTGGEVIPEFKPLRDLSVSANLSTQIFGTIQFAKGKLRGLRHQITPSVGLSYSPSTEGYYEYFDIDPDVLVDEEIRYNPFSAQTQESLIFNRGLRRGGMSVNYSLANTFEGKMWSKKDSTEKKFKIFNSVNLSGNYNLQADSLNWSPISLSANARIFQGKSTLSISGSLDPYIRNENGVRKNVFYHTQEGGKLLRWDGFTASLSTQMSLKDIRDLFRGDLQDANNPQQNTATRSRSSKGRPTQDDPELFSWFENFRLNHVFRIGLNSKKELETMTHSLQLTTGNIPLSDKWGMGVSNLSYDLKRKRWVYPSFTLTRDLHCWQMRITWAPQLDTYTFYIGVKTSPFSEYIKYQTGRNNFDVNRFR